MNSDTEYSKVEHHINLSKSLYDLDQKTKYIINQLISKKSQGTRRTGTYIFEDNITTIYNNLINCSSLKRLKLYFCLQYFLDELLYHEVKNLNKFYIEDSIYDISKLYFGQEEWITDNLFQTYEFYNTHEFLANEAMYLICYLKEFNSFLLDIEQYIKVFKDIPHIKGKLRDTIHRIRYRHNHIWNVILEVVNQEIASP
jgi:hypothetical protein